jgi:inner membrane protein
MRGWTQTATAKVIGIGLLALAMLIPLEQVRGLVAERQQMRNQAATQVAQGWGGRQVLGGLVLAVPLHIADEPDGQGQPRWHAETDIVLADDMHVDTAMRVEVRQYGIYRVPAFASTVKLEGRFPAQDLAQFRREAAGTWQGQQAELRLLLGDLRGLQGVDDLKINGLPARFRSSAQHLGGLASVVIPIDLDALGDQPIAFSMTLHLAGTGSMAWLPLARTTDVHVQAPWPDPSFTGAALPMERTVDAKGFDAHWRVLDLNRNFGQHWRQGDATVDAALRDAAFGVQLYQPVDVYQRNLRAGKYGVLFIGVTFAAFFLVETLRRLRVHPVQYLMIGAALATFYVVLLALSEQIAFAAAYAIAASSVVLIVGGYAAAVLHARRAGLILGGVLALVYAILYGLIAAEQYALLIGSFVLLGMVALAMYLTRRIDWYAATPAIMERP